MKEKTSKILLFIELVLFALPVTILFAYGGFMMLYAFFVLGTEYGAVTTFGPIILILCSLVSFYILALNYLVSGHASLANTSNVLWVLLLLGVFYSFFGIASIIAMLFNIDDHLYIFSFFRLGVFGLLLLPPVVHIFMVRKNSPANKTPKSTQ